MADAPIDTLNSMKFIGGAYWEAFRLKNNSPAPAEVLSGMLDYMSDVNNEHLRFADGSKWIEVPRLDLTETVAAVWNFNPSSGSSPFAVGPGKTDVVTNLNADRVDSFHASQALAGDTLATRNTDGTLFVATPTAATHAATKQYVDDAFEDRDWKDSVRVASTGNLNLSSMPATVDGVALLLDERFLAKDQSTGSENGIYLYKGAGVAAVRASDADEDAEVTSGLTVFVEEGLTHVGGLFSITTANPITVGVTSITFTQTGGQTVYSAGNGLIKAGNTFHFATSSSYSTGDIPYATGASTIGFLTAGVSGTVLKGTGGAPVFGAVSLIADVTGTLPVGNGGTGTSSQFTAGSVIFAGASGVYTTDSANLFWNDNDNRFGLLTNTPSYTFHLRSGASSTIADAAADDFVIEGATSAGLSVLVGLGGIAAFQLGVNGDSDAFSITHAQSSSATNLNAGITSAITINSSAHVSANVQMSAPVYYDTGGTASSFLDVFLVDGGSTYTALSSEHSMAFTIDSNNDDTDQKFVWFKNNATPSLATALMALLENGSWGVGTDSPSYLSHIRAGDSSTIASIAASTFVVEAAASAGISVLTGAGSTASFYMGANGDPDAFNFFYSASNARTDFRSGTTDALRINSSAHVSAIVQMSSPVYYDTAGASGSFLDLHLVDGADTYTAVSSVDSVAFLIDSDNTQTDRKFLWGRNSATPNSADVVAILTEDRKFGVGALTAPSTTIQGVQENSNAYAGGAPSVSNTILSLQNNLGSEIANAQSQIQFGINGGTFNRVSSFGTIAESGSSRNTAFVWCVDDGGARSEAMRLTSSGFLGINTDSPDGLIHAYNGNAGVAPSTSADDLIIESNSSAGMSFLTGSTSDAAIYFGDASSNSSGRIIYHHATDNMAFWANAVERIVIESTGWVVGHVGFESDVFRSQSSSAYSFLDFDDDEATTGANQVTLGSIHSLNFIADTDNSGTDACFRWMKDSESVDLASQLMVLTESAMLGVGGAGTPSESLHVLSGNARVDGLFKQTTRWSRKVFYFGSPGSNTGSGYWYIRVHGNTVSNIASLRVTATGGWDNQPVFGWQEAEYSFISGSGVGLSTNYYRTTKNFGSGNIRLEPLVEENGFISIPVWVVNSNAISVLVEYSDDGENKVSLTATGFTTGTLPAARPETAVGGFYVESGNFSVGVSGTGYKSHIYEGDAGTYTLSGAFDTLVLESDVSPGLSLVAPDAQTAGLRFNSPSSGSDGYGGLTGDSYTSGSICLYTNKADGYIAFRTGSFIETARLTPDGLGLGLTPASGVNLHVSGTSRFDALNVNSVVFTDASRNLTSTGTSDLLAEGSTNLYFSNSRARSALSSASSAEIAYNSSTGVIGLGTEAARIKFFDVGDNSSTSIVITHNFGTFDVDVSVKRSASPRDKVIVYWEATTVNTVTIKFRTAPTTNQFRASVIAANG